MSPILSLSVPTVSLPRFVVGRNHAGQWIARDATCRRGGVFVSRQEAVHYAAFESGGRPGGVTLVQDLIELNLA